MHDRLEAYPTGTVAAAGFSVLITIRWLSF